MGAPFASGKHAFGFCDRCGFRTKLFDLKKEVVKQKITGLLVCPECWTPDQPQLMLGTFPVYDPQALRNPRPDRPRESRDIQWNWAPVGGFNTNVDPSTPDAMLVTGYVGTVTIEIT